MAPNATPEAMSFNPFIVNENINNSNQDRDLNFFHESVSFSFDTVYVLPKDFMSNFKDNAQQSFSVLHLNIRRC